MSFPHCNLSPITPDLSFFLYPIYFSIFVDSVFNYIVKHHDAVDALVVKIFHDLPERDDGEGLHGKRPPDFLEGTRAGRALFHAVDRHDTGA